MMNQGLMMMTLQTSLIQDNVHEKVMIPDRILLYYLKSPSWRLQNHHSWIQDDVREKVMILDRNPLGNPLNMTLQLMKWK